MKTKQNTEDGIEDDIEYRKVVLDKAGKLYNMLLEIYVNKYE